MASSFTESTSTKAKSFPVIVHKELVTLLKTVREIDMVTSYSEVMDALRLYIMENKLFDPLLPVRIRCDGDPLSSVFKVKEFTIYQVRGLLSRFLIPIRINNFSAETTRPSTSSSPNDYSLKRKSEESVDEDVGIKKTCDQENCTAKEPMFLYVPPTPERNTLESDTAESMQGYETAFVKDTGESDDSTSFFDESDTNLNPGDILAVTETFDVEYEVESDSDQGAANHVSETCSDSEGAVDTVITFVCKSDSDVDFWADKSSDEDYDSDIEIPESDKWECKRCGSLNNPRIRYCNKCWCMRTGWVAPKREEKRSVSKRKQRTRRTKMNKSPDFEPTSTCKSEKSSELSSISLSSTSQNVEKMSSMNLGNESDVLSFNACSLQESTTPNESLQNIFVRKYSSLPNSMVSSNSSCSSLEKKSSIFYDTGSSSQDLSTLSSYSSSQEFPSTSSYSSSQEYPSSNFKSQGTLSIHKNNYLSRTPNLSTVPKCESDSKQCLLCCNRSANASIVHGKYAHQISCYQCAKKLQRENKRCPVCRRTIDRVVYHISVV